MSSSTSFQLQLQLNRLASAASSAVTAASSSDASVVAAAAAGASSTSYRLLLSQTLGATVSIGSALVKLPQLLNLLRSHSTLGLSLSMYSLELFTQSIAILYHRVHGFPLATYGENVSLGIGNMAILMCFVKMNRDPRAIVSLFFPLLLLPLLRFPSFLAFLQSCSIPLNIASKLPQILVNIHVIEVLKKQIAKERSERREEEMMRASGVAALPSPASAVVPSSPSSSSSSLLSSRRITSSVATTQLSPVPFALNFLGSLSRLYTTVTQLDGDRLMLVGFVISCVLNGAIVMQCNQIKTLQAEWKEEREKRTKAA